MNTPIRIDWDLVEMWNPAIGRRKLGITSSGQVGIPSDHVEVNGIFDTTSATFVNIAGLSLTLAVLDISKILINFSADFDGVGGGSATRIGYTVNFNGTDLNEYFLDFSASDSFLAGSFTHITPPQTPGNYVISGRMRRVSGTQTARVTVAMLTAVALVVP